ncbi:hypothetical protein ACDF64_16880 [Agromyces sp. MMS24-JH15]|uniref:hypothetical protein n=1 Tax=Agromyces sp. MMS24-JH15 TaxID=3243765 RepID=UPI003747F832
MAAQFLRLKLQLLANLFRRSAWQVVGIVLGLIYGLGLALLVAGMLVAARFAPDVALLRDAIVVGGSVTVIGFIVVPLIFGADDAMDPRRFSLFGLPARRLAIGVGLTALVGIPAFALTVVLVGFVATWSRGVGETLLAIVSAALALATCLLAARVATGFASLALSTRRARDAGLVVAVLVVVVLAPVAAVVASIDWSGSQVRVLESLGGILSWTPLGAAFAVPGDAAAGAWGPAFLKGLIAAATLAVLWLGWERLVARMLVTPGRAASRRAYRGLGWFDRGPGTAVGVVSSRALTYWFRDPRYWVSILVLPIVPVLVVVPLALAGLPSGYLPLIPVPLLALFIGWLLHNDTAYDSTAIWLHVTSGMRGWTDRFGRILPVLVVGIVVVGVGSAVTAIVLDDWRITPSVVGVSASLLFAGLGIGAISSARFPYPVVKPGDSPFMQPQSTGTTTAVVQSFTLLCSIVFALPALWFGWLGLTVDPDWHLVSLAAGTGIGVVVLGFGVGVGGLVFDRRGPEMLAAALRA